MEKEIFEKAFADKLNKNFPKFSKYFDFNLKAFNELNTLLFEINKCLLLEFNRAGITLTNNLLERLLKLALIYDKVGIGPKPIESWNDIFSEPNKKYNQIKLGNSIELCKKKKLITEKEKIMLFDHIRVLMRNGFSHADSTEILAGLPDDSIMHQATLDNTSDIQEVKINQKIIPFMQALQMQDYANENAEYYFDYVFNLIFRIEERLLKKQEQ